MKNPPPPPSKPDPSEGIFLYNDKTEKINTIYEPTKRGGTPEIVEWKNGFELVFKTIDSDFVFDVLSDTITKKE